MRIPGRQLQIGLLASLSMLAGFQVGADEKPLSESTQVDERLPRGRVIVPLPASYHCVIKTTNRVLKQFSLGLPVRKEMVVSFQVEKAQFKFVFHLASFDAPSSISYQWEAISDKASTEFGAEGKQIPIPAKFEISSTQLGNPLPFQVVCKIDPDPL